MNLESDPSASASNSRSLLLKHIRENVGRGSDVVMVVDDDKEIREMVTNLFNHSCPSITIIEAINGEDALLKLLDRRKRREPDPILIITDLQMPVMDGWDLIEELAHDCQVRGLAQGIPVIILSSSSGTKGRLFRRKSLRDLTKDYKPLVTVAKETCTNPKRFDAYGQEGLESWINYFLG